MQQLPLRIGVRRSGREGGRASQPSSRIDALEAFMTFVALGAHEAAGKCIAEDFDQSSSYALPPSRDAIPYPRRQGQG